MARTDFKTLLAHKPGLIGMIHLPALPGSPNYRGDFEAIIRFAEKEAKTIYKSGFNAIMFENLGDAPYFPDRVPNETVAAMAIIADRIKRNTKLPVGVNVLRNDALAALAIAVAAQLAFIRVNILTGAAVTDQGLIQGQAHVLLRERKRLHGEHVAILADIRVKHAAPLVERDLAQEVEEFFERAHCSAIIVSGTGSGKPVDVEFLRRVREAAVARPVLIGSGLNATNATEMLALADGAIVGSSIKEDGLIHNPIDRRRAEELVQACRGIK
jgi:membrane complex biogenesis BtpA family protein